jgi:NNP family nitrate/nitrite transporter-like MFS transporter
MFTRSVVGTANALVGGWGNLGGGVTQLVMGAALFPLFKNLFEDEPNPAETAWRWVSVVPAVVAFGIGILIFFFSDDSPKGNYNEMKKNGAMADVSAAASFRTGALNFNTWVLFVQYACCFGVELTMNNAAALYFKDKFNLTTEEAAAIASIFGWMNLFARGLGGFVSDKANARMGMRGRLWAQTIFLAIEGVLVLVFANTGSLTGAIIVMVFFSLFVQAAEGSSYGIVPYIDPPATGAIAGIIGAGGNSGAVAFGMGFRELEYKDAFIIMGVSICVSSVLSVFICIPGSSRMFGGEDDDVGAKDPTTLSVPQPDTEKVDDVNA